MLANSIHSRVVLINPARGDPGAVPKEVAPRRCESLSLLSAAHELFGIAIHFIGDHRPPSAPHQLSSIASVLDADALSLWHDERWMASLAASQFSIVLLGGAWLEEEVLIAALEGAGLGYDVRVLADLSIARVETDRLLALDRLALHGVLTMTVRQALLEWAVCRDDPVLKQRIRRLLS